MVMELGNGRLMIPKIYFVLQFRKDGNDIGALFLSNHISSMIRCFLKTFCSSLITPSFLYSMMEKPISQRVVIFWGVSFHVNWFDACMRRWNHAFRSSWYGFKMFLVFSWWLTWCVYRSASATQHLYRVGPLDKLISKSLYVYEVSMYVSMYQWIQ